MDEWPRVRLEEVCREITVGHVGPMADKYIDEGVPFLRSLNVEPFRVKTDGLKYIGLEFHAELKKSALRPGDVLIVRTGKPGACAIVPDWLDDANCSDLVIARCGPRLRARFLSYVVNSVAGQHIANHLVGAVQQHFNVGSARSIEFGLPEVAEQDQIVDLLGSLDDKLELNRRMNATLEAMARTIFKDWFVDFGPTRAKAEGRKPYLAVELWDLFPNRIGDKDVPVGWRVGTVGDCFHLTMGQSPPGSTYNDSGKGLPFFQGRTDFRFRYPKNRRYCTQPTRIAEGDDTLVSVRAPVGDINMAWEKCCAGRGIAALRHKSSSRSFTYYSMREIQRELKQYEHTGTVFGAINKRQFEALAVVEPASEIVSGFDGLVGSIDERIRRNVSENRALAQTRDLLLPKLVSGEIRLGEAEKAMETVI